MAKYRAVEKSQTLLLNEQSRLLESSGQEVVKFGFGQSPFPPLQAAQDALKANVHRKDYSPVAGIPELRKAVAEFHSKQDGREISAEQVLIAPGSKILLYAAMAVFEKADVLIPAPSWVSYAPQAKLLGHTGIAVETSFDGRWRVTAESIEKAVAKKASADTPNVMILNYPGNPDGLSYDADELQALVATLRKHKILVISDEIYGLLNHEGKHVSLANYYPEGTIVTTGLSKWCGAGGWRLGVAILPKELLGEYLEVFLGVASETYSCAPTPVQVAAVAAYTESNELESYLDGQRKILTAIGNWSSKQLQEAGVRVYDPKGGFYLFLDFSGFADAMNKAGIKTSQQLCSKLLADTGVALLPGDAFGMDASHLSARLAYVEFDGAEALKSAASGADLNPETNPIFAKVKKGIQSIGSWAVENYAAKEKVA